MTEKLERMAEMLGITLYHVKRPAGPGWYWARQRPEAQHGDSYGWRPVKVTKYSEWSSLRVTEYGDRERLCWPERVSAWEWGPRIEPPEDTEVSER